MIQKVITGGQDGADLAGWDEAQAHEIPTGGYMPRGYMTISGRRPEYADKYGAVEHASGEYPPRTRDNVTQADGTIIFNFGDTRSAGTNLAHGAAKVARKPVIVCMYRPGAGWDVTPAHVADWVRTHGIRTLNVAGNREVEGGNVVYQKVRLFLRMLFDMLEA